MRRKSPLLRHLETERRREWARWRGLHARWLGRFRAGATERELLHLEHRMAEARGKAAAYSEVMNRLLLKSS